MAADRSGTISIYPRAGEWEVLTIPNTQISFGVPYRNDTAEGGTLAQYK